MTSNYSANSQWQWRRGPRFVLMLNYRLNQDKQKGGKDDGFNGGDNF